MKVLITGVTGSGASYLSDYILQYNVKLIGTTRGHGNESNIKHIKDKIDLRYIDFTDALSVYRLFEKERPDIIFHIASIANVRNSFDNPPVVINNNISITLNLLESVRLLKNKDGYNPIIQICSTSEVYGNVAVDMNPITEKCPLNPINPYAVSKLAQDSLGYVYYLNYGMHIIRTRMFTYMNARRPDLFATAFAKQILEIKKGDRDILKHGNLSSVRTFIDIREAAEAYWLAANKCIPGETYNIGGITPVKIEDFLTLLIKKMGGNIKTEQDKTLLRPSDISVQIPDITKFSNQTGWKPKISFENSVDYFIEEIYKYWNK